MTLRTPRRRISPRAKRRYRAIREFFRRALGSSSQQDIKINSEIAVNVTDLKHKIVGIEHQLHEVSRHCRDLSCLETSFRRTTENLLPTDRKHDITTINEQTEASFERNTKSSDTKVLYKNSGEPFRKSDESDYECNECNNGTNNMNMEPEQPKVRNKNIMLQDMPNVHTCDTNLRKHKAQSNFENFTSDYSSSSFHSRSQAQVNPTLDPDFFRQRRDKKHARQREYFGSPSLEQTRERRHREQTKRMQPESPVGYEDNHGRGRKSKCRNSKLDQDFIAEIIKRQYKPVKLFGARRSDISQFSAPVCRDQEFSLHEDILEGEDLCSCCYEHNRGRYVRNNGLSDMRSICDTRLYSSARHPRSKHHRRHVDIYNDSTLYDLIPVKEKSSPKSRRKFVEDNMIPYDYYKEVPPSPRTLRPRLNLKAQYYTEYDDYMVHAKHPNRRNLPSRPKRQQECFETFESDVTSEVVQNRIPREKQKSQKVKVQNPAPVQRETGTMSSLQYPTYVNEQTNRVNDTILNKTQDTDLSVDKTDKALCEIKDILQNFLKEIKKDAAPSQCDKSDVSVKTNEKQVNGLQEGTKINTGIPNSNSFNNYSGAQCLNPPYMPPFPNPCCYPMMPICPMNCIQSGYMIPSPSFSCHGCANNQKETVCQDCSKNKKDTGNETFESAKSNETEELIKEIYKYVAQSPIVDRKHEKARRKDANSDKKQLTSRSAGSSSRPSRHDAKVGTPTMKCYSKSCEAIGSRMMSDPYYTTTTLSDTILEKLSLEVTQSDTELSSGSIIEKTKRSKFAKVLQSLGLLKKKKKDESEELSESESTMEVDIKRRHKSPHRQDKSPFGQDIVNYMMHGQEYYHRPPIPPYHHHPEGPYGYGPPGYDPSVPYQYPMSPPLQELYTPHRVHQDTIHEHATTSHYRRERPHPSAPPYPHSFEHPLCLKEIEVKSTGTQSERKMSFFRKLAKAPPPRSTVRSDPLKNNYTQTQQKEEKKGFFATWKEKAKEMENEPMKYSFKTQKKLAEGDMKMRNAMLKKMFHKRNPFSPGNLITRTLLGKDKSSFGDPPAAFKQRLFF